MGKNVAWSEDTKEHDGNPKHSVPYSKLTRTVRQHYNKTIVASKDISRQEYDMVWLDYCTANWVERGQASVL